MCDAARFLPNDSWMPIRSDFFDQVDQALVQAGAGDISVRAMVFGGLPIPLPPPDDFPGMGYTSTVDAAARVAILDTADLSGEPDPDVREAIEQVSGWLRVCADSGQDLVCFYH
jgi:hypothetical protein